VNLALALGPAVVLAARSIAEKIRTGQRSTLAKVIVEIISKPTKDSVVLRTDAEIKSPEQPIGTDQRGVK